jgi:hypothetical protein
LIVGLQAASRLEVILCPNRDDPKVVKTSYPEWCSWLLDQRYRGWRAFLPEHGLGENVYEYLAPFIFEGEV